MGIPYAEVIGDPIAHSKSPLIHEFWLRKLGLSYGFRRTLVRRAELSEFLVARRLDPDWCGCSVTLPHKVTAADLVDELSAEAGQIGAVNCITRRGKGAARLRGHNTDANGFLDPLASLLEGQGCGHIADVAGTGGAAAAVCYALERSGFTTFSYGRTADRAQRMRERLGLDFEYGVSLDFADLANRPNGQPPAKSDRLSLLVNATPLGMNGFPPLEVDLGSFSPSTIVYDLVYSPVDTPLLREAGRRGLTSIGGLSMLIAQAAASFELFFMEAAPREHDPELLELLVR